MVEVAKPDYLSLVNQNGTGFNIGELVTAMVDSEIVPQKVINEASLGKLKHQYLPWVNSNQMLYYSKVT